MQLISINRGEARPIGKGATLTGIYKEPLEDSVMVTRSGIPRDAVCNTKHHGGPDQAIYIYGEADYDWWRTELARPLPPGTFGENLTISGLQSDTLAIGDLLQIGAATLQVTSPRIPCATFALRMEEPMWVQRFRAAERPGIYCRVLREGVVTVGDAVIIEPFNGERVGILQMFRDYYKESLELDSLLRYLSLPVAIRARDEYEELLRLRQVAPDSESDIA